MTQQQFIEEIKRLSIEERLALLEVIRLSLHEDLETQKENDSASSATSGHSATQSPGEDKLPLSQRLYGIIKFDGDPPTDEEVKDIYADYLMEKYS